MENEEYKYGKNILEFEDNASQYFKLDYENQNVRYSEEYKKWKNSMIEKKGHNAKLFKCKIDNILFYVTYEN